MCTRYIIAIEPFGHGADLLARVLVVYIELFGHRADLLARVLCIEPFGHGGDLLACVLGIIIIIAKLSHLGMELIS